MSEVSRREAIVQAGLAALAGTLTAEAAQHVHQEAQSAKKVGAAWQPKVFNAHECSTLKKLADWIIPGASAAGACEFIDVLAAGNQRIAVMYTGGLAWIDAEMNRRFGKRFIDATEAQQRELLDLIAFQKNETPELGPGINFFAWARRMTADAYYTSPAGIKELGYMGNKGMTQFQVPASAIDYAVKRSGLG